MRRGIGPLPWPGSWQRSPVAAWLGEESWSRPGGGVWLLLTHRHSAVFPHRESISQTASRPHSHGPGCAQRHRGGQWRAFCIWWAADFHGHARVLMPHLVGMKDQSHCIPSPEHNPQLGGETPLHPRTVSSPEWGHRSLLEDEGMGKCREECARYRGAQRWQPLALEVRFCREGDLSCHSDA